MAEPNVVNARLQIKFEATDQLQSVPGAQAKEISNAAFNFTRDYTPTGTEPVTKDSYQVYTIAGGVADIDLTALLSSQSAIDGTGLKVQGIYVRNLGANVMTVGPGASNDYAPFGAGKSVDLPASADHKSLLLFHAPELLADVAAGDKMIRLTGTNGDQAQVGIWLG
ncbi:MAG: hypothetical protein AB7G51_08435 [Steroidobacteraceae bacterium]